MTPGPPVGRLPRRLFQVAGRQRRVEREQQRSMVQERPAPPLLRVARDLAAIQ